MALSADLISQFVKTTKDTTTASTSTLVYGTVKIVGDTAYVMVDGSEQLVPINSTATISDGNRVTMTIENHTATVTGNLTDVSASSAMVGILSDQVDGLVSIVDSMVEIDSSQIEIMQSDIEILKAHVQLEDSDIIITDSYLKSIESSIEALNSVIQITDSGVVISGTNLTIEGSDITVSGLDVDAVNSTVELVNSYLKVEDNVLYINGIEAGWIDVGSLSADVANINTLLAGNVGSSSLTTIVLTSENVSIGEAVIQDAMIDSVSATKLSAGIIDTNTIKIMSEDESLYIFGSLIAMYDENGIERIQIGRPSDDEDYNFVIWSAETDDDGNPIVLFNATGITTSGIPAETIEDNHVNTNANIQGSKLDIVSVTESINENGDAQINYANVSINGTTFEAVYTTVIEPALDVTDILQEEFEIDTENHTINAKVWESYVDDNYGYLKTAYSDLAIELDSITATVSKVSATMDYTGYTYRNYALTSGNYAEGEDNVWKPVSTTDQETIANYYDIYTCDGYTRVECITSNSQTYKIYIPLSDDFDNTVQHTFTVKLRLSNAVAILMGYRYYTNDASSGYFGYWTKSADNFTDGEWVTISATLAPNTSRTYTHFGIGLENVNVAGYYVDIAYVMEEEGSESHDWEPAPEDYGLAMTSLYSQMASLSVSLNNITVRVDTAYVNAQDALDLYSELELTVEGITSTVSAVLDLSYRNYALTSGNYTVDSDLSNWYWSGSTWSSYYAVTACDGYVELYCTTTHTTGLYFYLALVDSTLVGDGSTKYTLTFKIRRSIASNGLPIRMQYINNGTLYSQSIGTISASDFTAGEWSTVSITFTPTSGRVYKGVGFYLGNSDLYTADEYIDIAYVIVSEGEESPDEWCPAPEDYGFTDTLVNQYSTIQQLSDSITLAVFKDSESGYLRLGTGDDGTVQFTVESSNFTLDEEGNLSITGEVNATSGLIAGWAINTDNISTESSESPDEYYQYDYTLKLSSADGIYTSKTYINEGTDIGTAYVNIKNGAIYGDYDVENTDSSFFMDGMNLIYTDNIGGVEATYGADGVILSDGSNRMGLFTTGLRSYTGTYLKDFRFGSVTITPTSANTPKSATVTFSTPMAATPKIFVTPYTSVPGTGVTGVSFANPSTTGFTIYLTRTDTTATAVHYLAVC